MEINMNRKYWRAMGMSQQQHQRWRIETTIKAYFDYAAEADEWGINEEDIMEIIIDSKPVISKSLVKKTIKDFIEWQKAQIEDMCVSASRVYGEQPEQIVNYILDNPRRYFESPSGDITNLIGNNKESITNIVKGYFKNQSN
ncbi:MAG: hypothetical protein ABGX44_02930 [Candidatus Poseidoniia archaeon]|jgi:hypothetical protein|nr:MAG: hypothetical protein CXT68_00675 [Euryarchaeota archaeon]